MAMAMVMATATATEMATWTTRPINSKKPRDARNGLEEYLEEMVILKQEIEGLLLIEPRVFRDERGSFSETFSQGLFNEAVGYEVKFVQDNQSISKKGVLRGLHFQHPPHAQGKLVRVAQGSVMDVAVDIRRNSPTYGQHLIVELSEENQRQLWIPPGFAHGFLTLDENTIFVYKCTDYYSPECEGTIRWNDPELQIDWRVQSPNVSEKDVNGMEFRNFVSRFV
jgi:dTDP-4-dehydrorhamnose 3,5-epimerase